MSLSSSTICLERSSWMVQWDLFDNWCSFILNRWKDVFHLQHHHIFMGLVCSNSLGSCSYHNVGHLLTVPLAGFPFSNVARIQKHSRLTWSYQIGWCLCSNFVVGGSFGEMGWKKAQKCRPKNAPETWTKLKGGVGLLYLTSWWQLKYFLFSSRIPGEMIQFD